MGENFATASPRKYMNASGQLTSGAQVENAISLDPKTIDGFVNVGFTRGFASSQAYADRFDNESGILPPIGAPSAANLDQDMAPFQEHYEWLGFEVRRLIIEVLEQVKNDPALTLDALIYESKEPDILARLEALGERLRAIVDDHGEQGHASSAETISFNRLSAAGAEAKRMHFSRQQHNKVFVVRRNGQPVRVLCGSTNFSLRGLYIQANNALLFDDGDVAAKFGEVFDAYWNAAKQFRQNALSKQWWVVRNEARVAGAAVLFAAFGQRAVARSHRSGHRERAQLGAIFDRVSESNHRRRARRAR